MKHYHDIEQEGGPGDQRQFEMPIEAIENIPAPGESQQPAQEPQAQPAPLDTNVDGDELDPATMEAENQPHAPQPTAEDMEVEAGDRESNRPPSSSRPTSRPTTPVMSRTSTVVVDEGNGGTTSIPTHLNERRQNQEPCLILSMELLQRGLPHQQDHSSCRRWTSRKLSPARTEQRGGPTSGWEPWESPPRAKRRSTSRTSYSHRDRCMYLAKAKTSPGQVTFSSGTNTRRSSEAPERRNFSSRLQEGVGGVPQEPAKHEGLATKSRRCAVGWQDPQIH